MPDYKTIAQAIVADTRALAAACDTLADDELTALGRLMTCVYMNSYLDGGPLHADAAYAGLIAGVDAAIAARAAHTADMVRLAPLALAQADIRRTGIAAGPAIDGRRIVEAAMAASGSRLTQAAAPAAAESMAQAAAPAAAESMTQAAAPAAAESMTQAAMLLLMREPLSRQVYDPSKRSQRSYAFALGADFFAATLHAWADTLDADGSWTGVDADEAFGRLQVFESDFGSQDDIDNAALVARAYARYAARPCRTPRTLALRHDACVCRCDYAPNDADAAYFLAQCDVLQPSATTLADRLALDYVRYSVMADIEELGV